MARGAGCEPRDLIGSEAIQSRSDKGLGKNPPFNVVVPATILAGAEALTSRFQNKDDPLPAAMPRHQLAAAASPDTPIAELLGNFGDLDRLFDQLGQPAGIELGKPPPKQKRFPKGRAGSCPAKHNRALLGEKLLSGAAFQTSGVRRVRR
jgi:hypothetical protein